MYEEYQYPILSDNYCSSCGKKNNNYNYCPGCGKAYKSSGILGTGLGNGTLVKRLNGNTYPQQIKCNDSSN